jgi:hypothetical protein
MQAIQAAWAQFLPDARGRNLVDAAFAEAWAEKRMAAIGALG